MSPTNGTIYKLRAHVMELAYTETCDDTYRHRDGRDTYVWKAYRLTGHAGGYLVCVFDSFVNRRPSVFYVEHLDTAARQGLSETVQLICRLRHVRRGRPLPHHPSASTRRGGLILPDEAGRPKRAGMPVGG